MRKVVLLCFTFCLAIASFAQDAGKKTKGKKAPQPAKWTKGGVINLNINQGGYDNWLAMGDADYSIGVNGYLNLFANRAWNGKHKGKKAKAWTNNLEIFQAIQSVHDERTDENNFSKLDDRFDFLSRYSVQLYKTLSFATIANLRTQLYDTKNSDKKRVSGFFAPAVVTFAPGLEWKPCESFNAFITPASLRWVFLTNGPYSIYLNTKNPKPYGVNPDREVDFQPGAYAQFNLNKKLAKNINLKSRLDLYSNYRNNPENVDVFMTNFLSMKVNKWISAGVNVDLIYDDDVRQFGWDRTKPGLQYKHIIGVGFAAQF
ncbi:MAG: DUF3078 domain-containing protein [Dinghuibacter sp.]|nr:DUF3078 domain-containing protein [Dinghuibacter sp.]